MPKFSLHERLRADTIELTRWPLSLVLLMNARQWPWLILVPRRYGIREIYQLSDTDQATLMTEIVRASRSLAQQFRPDKINIGALGNLVLQLHVHVIARFADDPAWPGPVWGAVPPQPYPPERLQARVTELREHLAVNGP